MSPDSCLTNVKLWELLSNAELLSDDFLVEEILHLPYEQSVVTKRIISDYMKTGKLSEKDRQSLVTHYALYWGAEDDD